MAIQSSSAVEQVGTVENVDAFHDVLGAVVSQGECELYRTRRLLHVIGQFDRALIVTHDNPDPDAIATGWALRELITRRIGVPTRLVGGGAIVRAENRYMVELLRPPIELVDRLDFDERTAIILVDCGVSATHHLLAGRREWPTAVIDHHVTAGCDDV